MKPESAELSIVESRQRFAEYCRNPPAGSALARAIAHGIDPTLTFHAMFALTPRERLERAGRVVRDAQSIARLRERRIRRS